MNTLARRQEAELNSFKKKAVNGLDELKQKLPAAGFPLYLEGGINLGVISTRFAYFDTETHPGTVVELSETSGPKGIMFKRIAEAADMWDGSDPIRTEWPI